MKKQDNKNKADNPDNIDSKNAASDKEKPGKDKSEDKNVAQGKIAESSEVKADAEKDETKDKETLPPKIDEPIYPPGFYNKKDGKPAVSKDASKSMTVSSESAENSSADKSKENVAGKKSDKKKEALPPRIDEPIYPAGFYKKSEKAATGPAEEKPVPEPESPHKDKIQSRGSSVFTKVVLSLIFICLAGLTGYLLITRSQHDKAYSKAVSDLNSQIAELSSKQSNLLETIDAQNRKIAAQEKKLEAQEKKLQLFQSRADQMADISGKVKAFDEKISAFDDRISSYDYKIKAVSKSVFRASSAIASLEEKIVDLKMPVSTVSDKSGKVEAADEVIAETSLEISSAPEEKTPEAVVDDTPKKVDKTVPPKNAGEEFLSFMESVVEKIGEAGVWVYEASKPHVEKILN